MLFPCAIKTQNLFLSVSSTRICCCTTHNIKLQLSTFYDLVKIENTPIITPYENHSCVAVYVVPHEIF